MRNVLAVIFFMALLPLFALQIVADRVHTLSMETLSALAQTELTITRGASNQRREEVYRGVLFSEIIDKYGLDTAEVLEFSATDNYLVRLKMAEIKSYDPILATMRNGEALEGLRLIGHNMHRMHLINNIATITVVPEIVVPEPEVVLSHLDVLDNVRLYDPLPMTEDIRGYRLWDIISLISDTSECTVRLVSKDGIEQFLPFNQYLRDGVLVIDDDKYNIQSPNMPSGMWLKDIRSIGVGVKVIEFGNE